MCAVHRTQPRKHALGSYSYLPYSSQSVFKNYRSWEKKKKKRTRERRVKLKMKFTYTESLQVSISHYSFRYANFGKVPEAVLSSGTDRCLNKKLSRRLLAVTPTSEEQGQHSTVYGSFCTSRFQRGKKKKKSGQRMSC